MNMEIKKSTRSPEYVAIWVKKNTKALFVKKHAKMIAKGRKITHDELVQEFLKK